MNKSDTEVWDIGMKLKECEVGGWGKRGVIAISVTLVLLLLSILNAE